MAKQTGSLDLKAAKKAADKAKEVNQYFWYKASNPEAGAHITEVDQETFLSNPSQGGGNLLAVSSGIAVRDGLRVLGSFGDTGVKLYGRQLYGASAPAIVSLMELKPSGIIASIDDEVYFDINNPGTQAAVINYTGDGSTKRFRLYETRNSILYPVTVTINDIEVASTDYTITATQNAWDDYQIQKYYVVFNTAPAVDAVIKISYVPKLSACNFTLGERDDDTMRGEYSVAIGRGNSATEKGSATIGLHNDAKGTLSTIFGDYNEVKGTNSHAIGHGLKVSRAGVVVIGKYNEDEISYIDIDPSADNRSKNLFVIGKGSADNARSNALEIDTSGNEKLSGDLTAKDISAQDISASGTVKANSHECFNVGNIEVVDESTSTGSVAANTDSGAKSFDISKAGYYPIAIAGYNMAGTNRMYQNVYAVYLSAQGNGTGTVSYRHRNGSASSFSGTLHVYVLWAKY